MSVLPTEPRVPVDELSKYKLLIHSLSGVGKSSFVASIPGAVIVDTEKGLLAHSGYIVDVKDWTSFIQFVDELLQRKHQFETVVIDTLDGAYGLCWSYILKALKVQYPSEAAHGIGWDRITSEFINQIYRIQLGGFGIVATAHTMVGTVRIKGVEYSKFQPAFIGGSARSAYQRIIDLFDLIGYLHMEGQVKPPTGGKVSELPTGQFIETEARILDFAASQFWVSKDRSGRLESVKLTKDWREDWDCLRKAWSPGEASVVNE